MFYKCHIHRTLWIFNQFSRCTHSEPIKRQTPRESTDYLKTSCIHVLDVFVLYSITLTVRNEICLATCNSRNYFRWHVHFARWPCNFSSLVLFQTVTDPKIDTTYWIPQYSWYGNIIVTFLDANENQQTW